MGGGVNGVNRASGRAVNDGGVGKCEMLIQLISLSLMERWVCSKAFSVFSSIVDAK